MSETASLPAPPEIAAEAPRLMRQWYQTKLAGEAGTLNGMLLQGNLVRRLVRKTQNGTIGQQTTEPEDKAEDDMGVRVGDEINYHLHQQQPAAAAAATPTGGLSSFARAAALVAMGAGAGGAPLIASWLLKPSQQPPPAVQTAPSAPVPAPAPVVAPAPAPAPAYDPLQYGFSISSGDKAGK
jgi:hypothetical protein